MTTTSGRSESGHLKALLSVPWAERPIIRRLGERFLLAFPVTQRDAVYGRNRC
jgi:hypothetical protein